MSEATTTQAAAEVAVASSASPEPSLPPPPVDSTAATGDASSSTAPATASSSSFPANSAAASSSSSLSPPASSPASASSSVLPSLSTRPIPSSGIQSPTRSAAQSSSATGVEATSAPSPAATPPAPSVSPSTSAVAAPAPSTSASSPMSPTAGKTPEPASPPPKPRLSSPPLTSPPLPASTAPHAGASPSGGLHEQLSSPVKSQRPAPPISVVSSPPPASRPSSTSSASWPAGLKSPVVKPVLKTAASAPVSLPVQSPPVPASASASSALPSPSPPALPLAANVQAALLAKSSGQTDAYGNTTRCICHDNDNSDGFMLSCDTCIAVDTPVSITTGLARPIQLITAADTQLAAVQGEETRSTVLARGAVGSNDKGERAVSRLWLVNGQHLDLTDDHRVFVRGRKGESAGWKRARELRPSRPQPDSEAEQAEDDGDMVMMGLDSAVDDERLDTEDERQWTLPFPASSLPPLSFSSLSLPVRPPYTQRDRALAFARLLGYGVGCGRVRRVRRQGSEHCLLRVRLHHAVSLQEWQHDVSIVADSVDEQQLPSQLRRRSKGGSVHGKLAAPAAGYWDATLPLALSSALCALHGVTDGHPASSRLCCPPSFLTSCTDRPPPAAFLREYLAALFGARGLPMRCRRRRSDGASELDRRLRLPSPPPCPHHSSSSSSLLTGLQRLLHRAGCDSRIVAARKPPSRQSSSPSLSLCLLDPICFSRCVSYRYSAHKQLKLSLGCAFIRYQQTSGAAGCVQQEHRPVISSFPDFLSAVGQPELFSSTLPAVSSSLPVYYLPFLCLQPLSRAVPVYDLSMRAGHPRSFLASCMAVHNCDVWQHGDCLSVTERSVPEQYFCEICMPEHPIHTRNDSVRKSALNRKNKTGKGKKAGGAAAAGGGVRDAAAVPGSPGMDGKKKLPGGEKKKLLAGGATAAGKDGRSDRERERDRPGGKPELPKKKKIRREEDGAAGSGFAGERKDSREQQQPASKRVKLDDPSRPSATEREEKERQQLQQPPLPASSSGPEILMQSADAADSGGDGATDVREQKKLKKLLETIKKIEDQSVRKKKREGDGAAGSGQGLDGKDRDDSASHVGVVGVVAVNDSRAADDDALLDSTSNPSSPNVYTARSVRAKLRAEREEHDAVPGPALAAGAAGAGDSSAGSGLAAGKADEGGGGRRRKKNAAGSSGGSDDDDSAELVDFARRRRIWQDNKQRRAVLGPFYLGRKDWLLRDWRRERDREGSGWDDRVKEEELAMAKRVVDNWKLEQRERERQQADAAPGSRMRKQTNVDGIPTITTSILVHNSTTAHHAASSSSSSSSLPADVNGERKRKREEEAAEHDAGAAVSKNGSHVHAASSSSPISSPPSHPVLSSSSSSSSSSRPSIPKVSRPMLNGLAMGKTAASSSSSAASAGVASIPRLVNNRLPSASSGSASSSGMQLH